MLRLLSAFAVFSLAVGGFAPAAEEPIPKHLADARALVRDLSLANTKYEHGPGEIVWKGKTKAFCDCSGFINNLLMHSYGASEADLENWLGSKRPTAKRYHDAIAEGKSKRFIRVEKWSDARPGDLLAVKYQEETPGHTGHVMLLDGMPKEMVHSVGNGAEKEWEVPVIDSALSGHGPTDTRYEKGATHSGVGRGLLRVDTASEGAITGYTWSPDSAKTIFKQKTHPMVIGRWVKE